jgi:hypothetical protein
MRSTGGPIAGNLTVKWQAGENEATSKSYQVFVGLLLVVLVPMALIGCCEMPCLRQEYVDRDRKVKLEMCGFLLAGALGVLLLFLAITGNLA